MCPLMAQTGDRGLLVQSTEGEEEKRMGKDEDEIVVITIDEEDNGSVANNENLSLITNKDLNNVSSLY